MMNDHVKEKFIRGDYQRLYIPEILERVDELKEESDRVSAMRSNASNALMSVLFYVFDTQQIEFDLKPKEVNAIEHLDCSNLKDYDMAELTLSREYKTLSYLIKDYKKEEKLAFLRRWFDHFHPKETALVKAMFTRSLPQYPSITEKFVRQCYPNLLTPIKNSNKKVK